MGLDIYLEKIVNESNDKHPLTLSYDANQCMIDMFKYFDKYTHKVKTEYYDLEKYFKDEYGIDYEKEIKLSIYSNTYKFYDKNDKLYEIKDIDKIPTIVKDELAIYSVEIGYQRKGMKNEFYKEYLNKDIYVFWTNEQLEEIKKYCEPEANVLDWKLEDNQFIYCWN